MTLRKLLPLLALPLLLSACGDDDTPTPLVPASAIAGTYSGTLSMEVMGTPVDPVESEVIVAAIPLSETAVVTLPTVKFQNYTIPSAILPKVPVSGQPDGSYTLAATEIPGLKGTMTGKVAGTEITLDYTMQPGSMPMPINCSFKGTKK